MRTLPLLVFLALGALSGCIPRVGAFERFQNSPGQSDVLWLFVDSRLHRCVNLPRGPVCARVNYIRSESTTESLPQSFVAPPGLCPGSPPSMPQIPGAAPRL